MSADELNPEQISLLQELLVEQKQQLSNQLQQSELNSQPVTLDQQSVGRVSRIDAIQQQQMAVANRQQGTLLLEAISISLKQIDRDEYGYCNECGESIEFARLQVQPQASLCLVCQSKQEQR